LKLAAAQGVASIAFPSISTGIRGYIPSSTSCARRRGHRAELAACPSLQSVTLCCFSAADLQVYEQALSA
jgi:O-acetyl-ADP-ribose deacetylase (regulator of RNase III)